jgi:Tol biopolymer transport system component
MSFESGQMLLHYRLVEKIGEGGMGVVWRAEDTTLGLDVAIKVLPPAVAQDAERLARFEREAKLLASLQHPNIAVIHGLHADGDVRFLAMELIEGEDLSARLSRGAMTTADSLAIARQVAEALEVAHEQGIVHRDLKPANIQRLPDGQIKVLDFGLAKAFQPDPASGGSSASLSPTITSLGTVDGMLLGTAAYMSPEQARGRPVDKRADVWSFGCVLYEMLSGERAFSGETISDTLASVLKLEPDWDALPEDIQHSIRRLTERCLEKDARQRLRDVGEARITIERALRGEEAPAPAAGATAASDVETVSRGPSAMVLVSVLALVAIVAATAGWFLKPSVESDAPLRRFAIPVIDLQSGYRTPPSISPDGRRIVYVAGDRLWIRELDQVEPHEIAESENARSPFWSADGEHVAWYAGGKIWRSPVSSGKRTMVCDAPGSIDGGAWSADDRIVLAPTTGPLYEVPARGGDPRVLIEAVDGQESDFHKPSFLPDGKGLIYGVHRTEASAADTIEVFSAGERKVVLQIEEHRLEYAQYSPTGHLVYARSRGNDGIWAAPISLASLEIVGEPVLLDPAGSTPSVSRDGSLVYRQGSVGTERQLVWVDREGRELESIGPPQTGIIFPELSPDGRLVALSASEDDSRDIWIIDAERGTRTRLTFDTASEWCPTWSPDGARILYAKDFGLGASTMTKLADGTGEPSKIGQGFFGHYSDDGQTVILTALNRETSADILLVTPGDDAPKAFLQSPHSENMTQLSPDGRLLAYVSDEAGQDEVYLKKFPGGEGKWQVSLDGGRWPRWGPSGDELFFVAGASLMVVDVTTTPTLRLGTPRELFGQDRTGYDLNGPRQYDIAPDGRRFLVTKNVVEADHVPSLVFVENWFAEFRNKN